MTNERAREIVAQCVRNRMAVTIGQEYVPLPSASLAEMLEANAIVAASPDEMNEDGTKTMLVTCDPRGIAASYAFEQYGRSPHALLSAVGFVLINNSESTSSGEDDEEDDET